MEFLLRLDRLLEVTELLNVSLDLAEFGVQFVGPALIAERKRIDAFIICLLKRLEGFPDFIDGLGKRDHAGVSHFPTSSD